jgi:hypothetical protein
MLLSHILQRSHTALVLIALAVLGSGPSCESGDDSTKPLLCFYHGITETDQNNNVISSDPDDWCNDNSGGGDQFALMHAFPNPASISTTIKFYIPYTCRVSLAIKSIGCHTVRLLVDGERDTGVYTVTWDLKNNNGTRVSRGIYRCTIVADAFICHGDIMVE